LSGPTLATDPDWADAELAGKRIARKLAQAALAALVMVGVGLQAHFRIQLSPCWKFESGPARKQRGTRHMAQTVSQRERLQPQLKRALPISCLTPSGTLVSNP
jgi:hypothetical protein